MTVRALLLADGPSDLPLARHMEWICADLGTPAQVTPIDPRLMGGNRRLVESRIRFVLDQHFDFDLLFVHRDAEGQDPELRRQEVERGRLTAGVVEPVVPVVPVRMTEAWLLLDVDAIRRVAGRPSGREPLDLPPATAVERVADPKELVRGALLRASALTGRRRQQFERDLAGTVHCCSNGSTPPVRSPAFPHGSDCAAT